ncbi:uncharacterized protein ColSpa_01337 [Colletotrichum spaethianum]|uniref:Secreted protein n=1 Tax=Colletotrichum spaethianum TaxID=700344 RepID=A0AA37L378_9PEZI|nr:uncharacterized protein ColSpa_01337 [Colletotrichum spaethianum]GKT41156.1 hypothetical protein ColSpa_01337 [Colletotrichum spaethianum]
MQFTSVIVPAALFLASGCHAWAQAANGVWVANNVYYNIRGSTVHEACTTMNTNDVHPGGTKCSYWTNGVGQIFDGKCSYQGNSVLCIK